MNNFYVVAGNFEQFRKYQLLNKVIDGIDTSSYVYVSGPDMLRGLRDPKGVFIGTWMDRPDIEDIVLNLRLATSTSTTFNTGVSQAYQQLRERKTA